jgi:hypothetical protein
MPLGISTLSPPIPARSARPASLRIGTRARHMPAPPAHQERNHALPTRNQVLLGDYLRGRPDDVARYGALKRRLAALHDNGVSEQRPAGLEVRGGRPQPVELGAHQLAKVAGEISRHPGGKALLERERPSSAASRATGPTTARAPNASAIAAVIPTCLRAARSCGSALSVQRPPPERLPPGGTRQRYEQPLSHRIERRHLAGCGQYPATASPDPRQAHPACRGMPGEGALGQAGPVGDHRDARLVVPGSESN